MLDHAHYMNLTKDKIKVEQVVNTGVVVIVENSKFSALIRCEYEV